MIDRCSSSAVSDLLHVNEANEDRKVEIGEVVDTPSDEANSEVVEKFLNSQVDERGNEIHHVASEGGPVVSQSVDEDTYGSHDCVAATSSPPPPTHRCNKS